MFGLQSITKQRGRNKSLQSLCSILFFLLISGCVSAQTVQPVIQEYENAAKGSFDVINQGDSPMIVNLSTSSFSVQENGQMSFRALEPSIHIKLSAMSLRLAPHETSRVFYSASADQLPAWFVIYAAFSAPPRKDITGLNLRLELPHVVYLLPKHGGLKKDELNVSASYDTQAHLVRCTIQNAGDNFGRVQRLQVVGGSKREDGSSGGIFPRSRRVFEIAWQNSQPPEQVVLQFNNFKIEQAVAQKEP
jgi:hypothetical protein